MRISDWSSDVCSSDLSPAFVTRWTRLVTRHARARAGALIAGGIRVWGLAILALPPARRARYALPMPSEAGVAAKGFMSYVRRDNEVHNEVVDELKHVLEGRFHAATGRELEIFVDRDSIGWGADWRASIRESVQTATFFIPVITMRYFESEACREELLAFHEYTRDRKSTRLNSSH